MHGEFRLLSLGKASSHSTVLPICLCSFPLCAMFSCFCNPPNSMNYRIFNVRTRSFVCTWGLGTPTTSQYNILTQKKRSQFFYCAPDTVQTVVFGSRVDALPIEPQNVPCTEQQLLRWLAFKTGNHNSFLFQILLWPWKWVMVTKVIITRLLSHFNKHLRTLQD